ncbi:hypothetical protein E8E13_003867 [Curvularia kusanoi]|uniref:Uncharacterized protein n=1 Tax=Curvularia kusanoi TaxID=90978 RepID=A0A9P4TM40_CURKU|nr:hypothetical protein E8E13_003867 [Curvularia kusanoi]
MIQAWIHEFRARGPEGQQDWVRLYPAKARAATCSNGFTQEESLWVKDELNLPFAPPPFPAPAPGIPPQLPHLQYVPPHPAPPLHIFTQGPSLFPPNVPPPPEPNDAQYVPPGYVPASLRASQQYSASVISQQVPPPQLPTRLQPSFPPSPKLNDAQYVPPGYNPASLEADQQYGAPVISQRKPSPQPTPTPPQPQKRGRGRPAGSKDKQPRVPKGTYTGLTKGERSAIYRQLGKKRKQEEAEEAEKQKQKQKHEHEQLQQQLDQP